MRKCRLFAAAILAAILVLALPAAMADEMMAGMPNPMTEYASLEEMNEACGTCLMHPGVMGVSDESFYSVPFGDVEIASYSYSLNGLRWDERAALTLEGDISGLYINAENAFPGDIPETGISYAEDASVKAARWAEGGCQYTLVVSDEGLMDKGTFLGCAGEIQSMTEPTYGEEFYASFNGIWEDEMSGRAVLEAGADGFKVNLLVSWGDSAFETYIWTMSGRIDGEGRLVYSDCRAAIEKSDEQNAGTETVLYENGEGHFTFNPVLDTLTWDGAAEESCRECVFKLVPEA